MNQGFPSRNLTRLAATVALGAGLLLQAPLSFAQSAATPAPQTAPTQSAPAARAMTPRSDTQIEAHLKRLHDQLKITAAEEDQWKDLAQVIRGNEHQISSLIELRRQSGKSMTALDNLRGYADITQAHADGMKKLVPAFEKLYGQMSDAQKKIADNVFNQRDRATARSKPATPAKPTNG
jgi:protein CpxP